MTYTLKIHTERNIKMSKGLLIVVSAPSGCGKGTILAQVLKNDNFYYSVSATTRSPREGEVDGVNYYFLTKEGFEKLIAEDGMLEHACYCGNYYGTPRKAVFDKLEELCSCSFSLPRWEPSVTALKSVVPRLPRLLTSV